MNTMHVLRVLLCLAVLSVASPITYGKGKDVKDDIARNANKSSQSDAHPIGLCDDEPSDNERCYKQIIVDPKEVKRRYKQRRQEIQEGRTKDDLEAQAKNSPAAFMLRTKSIKSYIDRVVSDCAGAPQSDERCFYQITDLVKAWTEAEKRKRNVTYDDVISFANDTCSYTGAEKMIIFNVTNQKTGLQIFFLCLKSQEQKYDDYFARRGQYYSFYEKDS